MSMPAAFHYRRNRTACRHADAAPGSPVDDDAACLRTPTAQAAGQFAQQVVGGTVVGLAAVAEASGNELNETMAPIGMPAAALSRLNMPSAMSKTRSGIGRSVCRSSALLISMPPACEDVDSAEFSTNFVHNGCQRHTSSKLTQ